jgi:hypothetical protein
MEQQNSTHFRDGAGVGLHGMARPDDQLGRGLIDVGALVAHDPVVASFHRAVAFDGDYRMSRYSRVIRGLQQTSAVTGCSVTWTTHCLKESRRG